MNIALTIPLADGWGISGGIGAGWLVVMGVMMLLCMGGMMFGMGRMGRGSERGWSAPWERSVTRETPVVILERRFAEGEISAEEYRARREVLVNGAAEEGGAREDGRVPASLAGEGRR